MINYDIHENGWTIIVRDFDLRQAKQQDINHIAKLLATNTIVVFRNQNLTIQDEIKVAKMFKDPQVFNTDTKKYENYKGCEVKDSENLAFRVTGEEDELGRPGLAGEEDELQWHANDHTTQERKSLVWLYAVRGSKGSRTTWNNNILSYENLEKEKRKSLENLTWIPFEVIDSSDTIFTETDPDNVPIVVENYEPNLVMTNIADKKGFYFPFNQIYGFNGMTKDESKELILWLSEYTTQDKFCYHHDWEDGDLVISEQWLGIHKRWPFKGIKTRLLHRMAFEFPDQDYKSI